MRMYDLITKKKHGEELTDAEIREFITEYTAGNVPDYQVSALMMAIYFKGMCDRETSTLTMAMSTSGDTVARNLQPSICSIRSEHATSRPTAPALPICSST